MNKKVTKIVTLTVQDVQKILKIGRNKAYEIFARADFPGVTIGKKFVVEEQAFKNWLQKKRKKA